MVTMKKLILLPVLMLATVSLNGMGRFAQQALPALHHMSRGAKPILLPATMPGIRSTGMRLLSASSRTQQDGYDYAGYAGEQQARFGGREAWLLGGAAALAGATAYYFSTPEGQLLRQAHAATESDEIDVYRVLTFCSYYPKIDAQFSEAYKLIIDNLSQEDRLSHFACVSKGFIIETLHTYSGFNWWDSLRHKNRFIQNINFYLDILEYVAENYPESVYPLLDRVEAERHRRSRYFQESQQKRFERVVAKIDAATPDWRNKDYPRW
jgi:hypothetical protein